LSKLAIPNPRRAKSDRRDPETCLGGIPKLKAKVSMAEEQKNIPDSIMKTKRQCPLKKWRLCIASSTKLGYFQVF
jgi:hypothetical protein